MERIQINPVKTHPGDAGQMIFPLGYGPGQGWEKIIYNRGLASHSVFFLKELTSWQSPGITFSTGCEGGIDP
jgi:hypothetical protein